MSTRKKETTDRDTSLTDGPLRQRYGYRLSYCRGDRRQAVLGLRWFVIWLYRDLARAGGGWVQAGTRGSRIHDLSLT